MKKSKESFLATNIYNTLSQSVHMKYKEPESPTISCPIRSTMIERILLDLGASVNLLSYSVSQQYRIGELRPTKITLQLADRSMKKHMEEIEEVLLRLENSFFWLIS